MNTICKTLLSVGLLVGLQTSAAGLKAQDTLRLSLDSCLRYAYSHSLAVQNARLGQESAEATLAGARMRFLPGIDASASQGWDWSGTAGSGSSTQYGLNASLTLFSGLANLRNLQQSRLGAEQSSLRVRQAENNIGIQTVQAYLTVLMNQEKLSFQQEVLETSRQQQLDGEVKYQVGRILESDYLLLAANHTSALSEIENTQLTIDDNINTLNDILFTGDSLVIATLPLDDTLRAADRVVPPHDSVMAQAQRSMPDWQISEMAVEMARKNVDMARSAFMPSVSLNAGYGGAWLPALTAPPSSFSDQGSLSVGIHVPLFSQGSSITQLKQSKIALQQAELQHQQDLIDIRAQIDDIYLNTQQTLNRYRASEALAEAYRASYQIYVIKHTEGAVTTVEMLQQQDRYLSALNDYLQNKYTYILSDRILRIYLGEK